jgi:ABC-type sulfate transport system substrate-binding protein
MFGYKLKLLFNGDDLPGATYTTAKSFKAVLCAMKLKRYRHVQTYSQGSQIDTNIFPKQKLGDVQLYWQNYQNTVPRHVIV